MSDSIMAKVDDKMDKAYEKYEELTRTLRTTIMGLTVIFLSEIIISK